jgi:hypothetical protein
MRNAICAIAAASALATVWAATSACQPRICDSTHTVVDTGKAVDQNTWESVTLDEPWHDYPGGRTVEFLLPEFKARRVLSVEPYVAFAEYLNDGKEDFTLGSGDITEVLQAGGGIVKVRNGTCANLHIRVVVHFAPSAGPTAVDASAD